MTEQQRQLHDSRDRESSKQFGIVYVDFPTQHRLPKDSAHWYREAIARVGLDGAPPSPNGGAQ
jgi:hypothetical protein